MRTKFTRISITVLMVLMLTAAVVGVSSAATADPDSVSFTLEGCRNDGSILLPINGRFVCPDSAYTTGNLGKGWNELDLVPYRITTKAGNAAPDSQTYAISIALDNFDAGHPGYDVLGSDGAGGAPVLNTALSDASCTALTSTAQQTLTPGVGGIDQTIYRILTITQAKNTTCVYDWYGRLALGSHLFPGSSLHANLLNQNLNPQGIGSKDVSIPVKEILPQELSKDMSASQGTDHIWDISKDAMPAKVSFGNTCSENPTTSVPVEIKVLWEKKAASPSGDITIVTHVYAKNPASRTITVSVTDEIRSGTTVLNTVTVGGVDVPANTTMLVLTHQVTVPAGVTDLNDVATATYTDKITGVPVPGNTTATASADVQLTGPELNASATINDVESISGANFSYSADSFSGASGAFDGGYVAGTATTDPVSWTSDAQSGSGSVTFSKTLYVSVPVSSTGALSDTATLTGSNGFTAQAVASIDISADALVSLTINKTIDVAQSSDTTFTFKVLDGATEVAEANVTIPAGDTSGSAVVPDLTPGVAYTIDEVDQVGWKPNDSQTATVDLPNCSGSVTFDNTAAQDLTVSKTATPSFTRTYSWDIQKLVNKTHIDLEGTNPQSATFNYTVSITHDAGADSAWKVDGTITVANPNDWMDISADVTDALPGAACTVDGAASKTVNVPAGDSVNLPYSCSFASAPAYNTDLTNTATATWDQAAYGTPSGTASGSKNFQFANPTKIVDGSVTVVDDETDPNNPVTLGTVSYTDASPKEFKYSLTKTTDPSSCKSFTNTASFTTNNTGTTGSASQTVEVCASVLNVQKLTQGVVDPTKTWNFALYNGPHASSAQIGGFDYGTGKLATDTTLGNNTGLLTFGNYNIDPAKTYTFCELNAPAGWASLWTYNGNAITPYNPDAYPNPPSYPNGQDMGVRCFDFGAGTAYAIPAGGTITFQVDNHYPGGEPRTIGYWKNWSSCTGGKQVETAAKNGGKDAGYWTLDDVLNAPGITIGSFTIPAANTPYTYTIGNKSYTKTGCEIAVALLGKSDAALGKNHASDAAYGLAAQLIAAKANLTAGAEQCYAINNAVLSADALLTSINFNGTGSYLDSKVKGSLLTTRNDAISLAGTIDEYNNGMLCP